MTNYDGPAFYKDRPDQAKQGRRRSLSQPHASRKAEDKSIPALYKKQAQENKAPSTAKARLIPSSSSRGQNPSSADQASLDRLEDLTKYPSEKASHQRPSALDSYQVPYLNRPGSQHSIASDEAATEPVIAAESREDFPEEDIEGPRGFQVTQLPDPYRAPLQQAATKELRALAKRLVKTKESYILFDQEEEDK